MLNQIRRKVTNQVHKINSTVSRLEAIEKLLAETLTQVTSVQHLVTEQTKGQSSEQELSGQKLERQMTWTHQAVSDIYFLQLLASDDRYKDPRRLPAFGNKFFSQNDEDGIIAEIFNRIGTSNKTFVELGCGDGMENNSLYLLLQGWKGYWLEGNPDAIFNCQRRLNQYLCRGVLQLSRTHITKDSIASTLKNTLVPTEPDLLSIDLDGNDYYIMKSCLEMIRPRAIIVEYNALLGPSTPLTVRYDPDRTWDGTTAFGASLKAIELLGSTYGYSLVGCTLSGINAFLVRNDCMRNRFAKPFTSENHFEPYRYPHLFHSKLYAASIDDFENPYANNASTLNNFNPSTYCETKEGKFFVSPFDRIISEHILLKSEWEPSISRLIKQTVCPGDLVFDIGANIGWYSVLAAKAVGPLGHVVAIEPETNNFQLLERNLDANECFDQVSAFKLALSDRIGGVDFTLCDTNFGDHRLKLSDGVPTIPDQAQESARKTVKVQSTTLDDLVKNELQPDFHARPIRLMKVDTQGAEVAIYKHGQNTLSRVQVLISEYCPYAIKHLGFEPADYWKLLKKHFSSAALLTISGLEVIEPPELMSIEKLMASLSHELDYSRHYDLVFYR